MSAPHDVPEVILRAYQRDGVEALREKIRAGVRRVLAVLATGGGKTVIAAAVIVGAVKRGKSVLFLAHRRELISQCYAKLRDAGLRDDQLGVILASDKKRRRPNAPVQVASVQTLAGRPLPPADLIFVDEAHHARAATYGKILDKYPGATVVGLTATPCRADGKGLGDVFADLVPIASFPELVEWGFLDEPRVFTSRLPVDLSKLKATGGDYNLAQLDEAMNKRELVGDILAHWQKHAEGRSTIIFASSVEHSKAIVEQFCAAGIAAEHIDGTTPADVREEILGRPEREDDRGKVTPAKPGRLATGETTVVVNMGVLTEGFDCPRVKCIVLARPTKSLGLFLQMAGRGLRPWGGVSALLLDHAGCVAEHGFPQDDREWSLDGRVVKAKATTVRTCPNCQASLRGNVTACPECWYVFEVEAREALPVREGELVEAKPSPRAMVKERREFYFGVLNRAAAEGRKVGWARHRYHEKYETWPDGFRHLERAAFAPKTNSTPRWIVEHLAREAPGATGIAALLNHATAATTPLNALTEVAPAAPPRPIAELGIEHHRRPRQALPTPPEALAKDAEIEEWTL